jgi:hypothetical protein
MIMRASSLPDGPLTFGDYFKLNMDIEDVLAHFGYSYRMESCQLPRKALDNGRLSDVKRNLERGLPHINLVNEAARREFLIAPVVIEVAIHAEAKVDVELPLEVDEKLKGTLDYLVRARHGIVIIEAKNGDLKRGFTQLAVELLAFSRWNEDEGDARIYGAVSMGDVWKFGFLDREEKRVVEDLNTYSVPTDIEEVGEYLNGILTQ